MSSVERVEPTSRRWELRRRSLPEMFDIAFVLYRAYFKTYLLNRWALWAPIFRSGFLISMCALAAELFICAVTHIAITLLYYDLRIRREGLDITLTTVEDLAAIRVEA